LTARIPYWGYHIKENRRGTHRVDIEIDVDDIMDWGLLGYYLGEVIRQRLFSEFGDPPRVTQVKTSIRHGTLPLSECDDRENGGSWQSKTDLVYLSRLRAGSSGAPGSYYCENLFVLDAEDVPGDAVITVSYDGKSFSIPRDSNRGGRTLQVLELVKQLLALNTSARQLPSTSVLSVVGGNAQ
jgi:hypothetical protein